MPSTQDGVQGVEQIRTFAVAGIAARPGSFERGREALSLALRFGQHAREIPFERLLAAAMMRYGRLSRRRFLRADR